MAKKNKTDAVALTLPVIERKLTKTGLLDRLISADLAGSYGEGAKENIVAQVLAAFPELDAKRTGGLFFSRRAVIRKQAEKAAEAAQAQAVAEPEMAA